MESNPPANRAQEVMQLRLLGALPADLARHATEQNWQVTDGDLKRYQEEADKLIAQAVDSDHSRLLAFHVACRHTLLARAMAVSDYKCALSTLQDLARLQDVYPAPKRSDPINEQPQIINIFERATFIADQLRRSRPAIVDARISASDPLGERGGESLDQARADAEAIGIPVAG